MFELNMKDKEFKTKCKQYFNYKSLNIFNSDYEIMVNGQLIIIEYENSSRGMVHNLVKIMVKHQEYKEKVTVVFFRTVNHLYLHNADYIRFMYLVDTIKIQNLEIVVFDDEEVDLNLKEIRKLKAENDETYEY